MELLCKLVDQMRDEAEGAEEYAECAMHHKDSDRTLADVYINMARTEMEHFEKLFSIAAEKASDDPSKLAVLAHCEKHCLHEVAEAKVLIESYR